jgi:hypothetical protein
VLCWTVYNSYNTKQWCCPNTREITTRFVAGNQPCMSFLHSETTWIVQQWAESTFLLLPFILQFILHTQIFVKVIHKYTYEAEYIQQYEDIHTNFYSNCQHDIYIYYTITLNVMINKNSLWNIKLNIVQMVDSDIFRFCTVEPNMYSVKNTKNIFRVLHVHRPNQNIYLNT